MGAKLRECEWLLSIAWYEAGEFWRRAFGAWAGIIVHIIVREEMKAGAQGLSLKQGSLGMNDIRVTLISDEEIERIVVVRGLRIDEVDCAFRGRIR